MTGRQPFGGDYEQAMIYSILNETPRPLDDSCPPELAEVIGRALKKDPAERYATAEELEEDLAGIPLGDVAPRRARSWRWLTQKRKWLVGGLAALVVLGIALGAWYQEKHRWDFSPQVAQMIEQGEKLEWRGDTKRDYTNAEKIYRQALSRDPDNPLIKAQLAALLSRFEAHFPAPDRRKELRLLIAETVERASDDPRPWVAQAKLFLVENSPEEAEKAARRAIEEGRDSDRGYTLLGEALIAQGLREEGFEMLRKAVGMGQGYLRARLVLAYHLKNAGQNDEAASEFRKVLDYDPDHPTANHNLGAIYLASGRDLESIPLFRKVFETTRDYRAANSLGIAYFNLDRMDEAIAAFRDAYELEPSPAAARNVAEGYEKKGRDDEARRWYKLALDNFARSLSQGGDRAELLFGRSFCAAKLGLYDQAFRDIQEAMRIKPERKAAFLFRAAQICAMAGRREEVYSNTRQAIEKGYPREEFRRDLAFREFQDQPRFRAILESATR